jgi:small subunit ribosomal protein S5
MDTPNTTTETKVDAGAPKGTSSYQKGAGSTSPSGRSYGRGGDRRKTGGQREKPEFDQKILSIRRVTRVVSGGRRFSFSVAMLVGDKKGSVGLGLGKSSDTTLAINKAVASARKHMFKIATTKEMSISHAVEGKFKASRVMIMPNKGKGLVVGGALRDLMILGGLKNVTGKIFSRSKTHLNNAKAAVIALKTLKPAKAPKVAEVVE